MLKKKHIIFTGGGSAGHVTPNLALIEKLHKMKEWQISYIGSQNGIERTLIKPAGITYFPIATGKLRRYFSWQNFIDPFKIIKGIWQAFWLCHKLKPHVIFSKGGFVSFPVVIAGWLQNIPVILHESDLTPGLANKLSYPFAKQICLTFPDSVRYFSQRDKITITGTPIRTSLLHGKAEYGLALCDFKKDKKVILILGGSLGATSINRVMRAALPSSLKHWQVIHICGADRIDEKYSHPSYQQFAYLHEDLANVMAAADIVISRSGANAVYELLALKKPHIFIPLSKKASRGDQIDNALHFAKLGVSQVILEENLTPDFLVTKIHWVMQNYASIVTKLHAIKLPDSNEIIYKIIEHYADTTMSLRRKRTK